MGCSGRWAYLVVLGGVCFCLSATGANGNCKFGASGNGSLCSGGCLFGFARNKDGEACGKDVLKFGLEKCEDPSDLVKKTRTSFQEQDRCTQCKKRWSGDFCTRENIAFRGKRRITDENFETCPKFNTSRILKLNSVRGNGSVIAIHLEPGKVRQLKRVRNALNSCSIEGCNEKTWVSDSELMMKCPMPPSRNKNKLKLNCAQETKIRICEIKVYKCMEFWWSVETGCNRSCNCQDGESCDAFTGQCPPGKECMEFWWSVETGCNRSCNCQDGESCDAFTGQCPPGKEIETTTTSSTTTEVSSSTASVTPATPSASVTPATPSASATPATPSASATPATPSASATPATSSASATPATSSASATPATPSASATPASSSASATPATSSASATPATPSASATPATSSASATPATSSASATPATSSASATPATSSASATPATSSASATPATPSASATPATPSASATPATSSASATPATSSASATPATPSASATPATSSASATPDVSTSDPDLNATTSLPSTESSVGTSDGHSPSQVTTTSMRTSAATTQGSVPSSSTDQTSTGITPQRPDTKTSPPVPSSATTKKEEHVTPATSRQTLGKSSVTAEGEKEEDKKRTSTVRTLRANSNRRKEEDDDGGSFGSVMELTAIAGAIVALVLVAVLAGILYKKKMRQRETKADENDDTACVLDMEMDNRTPPSKEDEEEMEGIDSSHPFDLTTEPIAVDDFTNYLRHMKRCGGYSKEFQELPRGIQNTVTAAMEADDDSVRKNRFKNISHYDETRVVLKKEQETDSDYINTSYIAGFNEAMAYIAAQGPLPDTVGDFWHMVWTEGCSKVVMLTNLCEGSKVKCEQYWPDVEGSSQTFGVYVVTCVKVVKRAHFIHRHLRIAKQSAEQDGDSVADREIQHLHFTAWPDHGVPCPVALVRFWSYVVMQPVLLGGPMLVHCSAGIGRTGTFIALDMLTRQAETTGKVSVFPTVRRLRKQRVNMVQTLSQYRFLHEVVQEWLSCRDCDLVRSDLQHGTRWKGEEGESATGLPSAVREQCAQQFKMLDELRPTLRSEDMTTAEKKENVDKNRFPHILPVEMFRVCLAKLKEEDSDYVNAVFLPSLGQSEGYIVTQLPLDGTVTDFWHMVRDWNVTTVVRFLDAPQDQAVSLYPDRGQTVQHGTVNITTTDSTVITPGLSCYTLTLQETQWEKPQSREVSVYCVDSQQALKLTGTKVFLALADILLPLVRLLDQPPVVLQCFNGAGPSCILCAVLMGIELLQEEERTSPFLLARLVHTTRPHAFSTCEQYEFMVRCLWHHTRGITEEGEAEATTEKADATTEKADATTDNGQEQPASDTTDHVYANT